MKQLLCFGDSNTWGYNPKTKKRYSYNERWTGILQKKTAPRGVRVIEEGLCGRTTFFDDASRDSRNGLESLPQILEYHSPLDAAILMLGTNDCKSCYNPNPELIARGIVLCVDELLKRIPAEKILLVSPIYLGEGVGEEGFDPEFDERSVDVSRHLFSHYRKIAEEKGVGVINAAAFVQPSEADREHFTLDGHSVFANLVFKTIINNNII